jgi:AmmeMemoRadiSam system protein B
MAFPALRHVDIIPVDRDGESCFCLVDQEGIIEEQVLLSPLALFVASQLDGEADTVAIQKTFAEHSGGKELPEQNILDVAAFLDEQGFLYSARYEELRQAVVDTFAQANIRPAHLAGKAYPDDAEALRPYIDELFTRDGGPGALADGNGAEGSDVRGLIVPHIDFERGGHSYAHGYTRLAKSAAPKTVLVFGVAHASPPVPFVLTKKHYDTPFGTVETDQEMVDQLAAVCTWDPWEHEITHRTEHSIEFHAVMLGYLYGTDVRIVPILCSQFDCGDDPAAQEPITTFLDTCRDFVVGGDGAVAVLAGADLAHVGPRFGDAFDVTDEVLTKMTGRDEEDLAHVLRFDAAAWYKSVMRDENERRVCGINCIYSAMRSLEGIAAHGELLHYGYAPDPNGGVVSFAGVALT